MSFKYTFVPLLRFVAPLCYLFFCISAGDPRLRNNLTHLLE
jgi:hypothetical protein